MTSNAKEIASEAARLRLESIRFKEKRSSEIKRFLGLYNNNQPPVLPGFFSIPLPTVPGFIDSLLSKTDEPISVAFSPVTEADYSRAKLMTAAFNFDHAQSEESDWDAADRQERKGAIFSGIGVAQVFAESDPEYKSIVRPVEFEDFIFDPVGSSSLETHTYQGRDGIWRSKRQMQGDLYAQDAVNQIFQQLGDVKSREDDYEVYEHKKDRYISLSLNPYDYSRSAVHMVQFVEMGLVWKDGERYYVFFEPRSMIPVRCEKWSDVFESGLWDKTSWATHEDSKNFLSKTALHDIVPVADAMQIAFNLTMDNVRRRNMPQKLFRAGDLVDPNQLRNYMPDSLVEISATAMQRALPDIVRNIDVPDTTAITENLISFMDGYIGQKTGITPSAQGVGQEKQATILVNNLKQVADRLGLYNKYYTRAQRQKVLRWAWGQYEHMPKERVLRTIGASGSVEWMTLFKKDAKPEFDIIIKSKNAEEANDTGAKQEKMNTLMSIKGDPMLSQIINPKKMAEELFKVGNFEDEEIADFLDKDAYSNKDILSQAAQACEEILGGKEPSIPMNFEANMAFLLKINNFIKKLRSNKAKPEIIAKLNDYFNTHVQIVQRNQQQDQSIKDLMNIQGQVPGNPDMAPQTPGQGSPDMASGGPPTPPTGGIPSQPSINLNPIPSGPSSTPPVNASPAPIQRGSVNRIPSLSQA